MVGGAGLLRRDQKGCWDRKRLRNADLVQSSNIYHTITNVHLELDQYISMLILYKSLIQQWYQCITLENFHQCIYQQYLLLTLWEPGYDIFILWNQPKTSSCQLPYQHHRSYADCTREMFKSSNRSASLDSRAHSTKYFWLGVVDFLWVTS